MSEEKTNNRINHCNYCGDTKCAFVQAAFSWASGFGNICCKCIPEAERKRVCKPCYIKGIEIYGGA